MAISPSTPTRLASPAGQRLVVMNAGGILVFFGIGMFYFPKGGVSVVFANNQVDASVTDDLDTFARIVGDAGLLDDAKDGGTKR